MIPEIEIASKFLLTNIGLSFPYQINFAITYKCNSRCKFCNIWRIKSKNELSLEEIKKIASKSKFINWIRLTGGEPFLRHDYVDIVKTFKENCKGLYIISSPTNAIAYDLTFNAVNRVLKFFRKKYVITISLDGYEELHDKIRGIKGNWKRAIKLYKKLSKIKEKYSNLEVYFGYTIYPENLGEFEKTYESVKSEIKDISPNEFNINLFEVSGVYYHNLNMQKTNDYVKGATEEIKNILRLRKKRLSSIDIIQQKYLELAIKFLEKRRTPIRCNILNLSCFIDPYGNVYPCTIFGEKLGNLRENDYDLKKILNSKKVKKIKKITFDLKCPNCWTPCEAHQLIISNLLKV